jgi:hypothetical protein
MVHDDEVRLIPDVFDLPPVAMDLEKIRFIERLHPKHWLSAAREHRYAAEIIFTHELPFRGHPTRAPKHASALLLYGFAFECLLKGIIIAKNPDIRNSDKWGCTAEEDVPLQKLRDKDVKWMTHDMLRLIELAEVQVSNRDRRFLWQLEAITTWGARYPVSRSVPKGIRYDEDKVPDFIRDPNPNDPELIRSVFSYLESQLISLLADASPIAE